jgi:hypothetical protein
VAAISSTAAHHRARIAALSRDRKPDDPELIAARRDFAYERLFDHINKVVDSAPPASPDQLARIAAVLKAGAS